MPRIRKLAPYPREIVRDLIYNKVPVAEITKQYGIKTTCLYQTLKTWCVNIPVRLASKPGIGWQEAKDKLPVPGFLRVINRSDFIKLYRYNTQNELAKMFGVARNTISHALTYHCIKRRTPKEAYTMRKDQKDESTCTQKRRA